MDLFVGVTDGDWYELLANQPGLDEVNQAEDFIVGGGVFAHSSLLPTSLAWESFGIGNGATTIVEMRARIEKYRKQRPLPADNSSGLAGRVRDNSGSLMLGHTGKDGGNSWQLRGGANR